MKKSVLAKSIVLVAVFVLIISFVGCEKEACKHEFTVEKITPPTHEEEGITAVICNNCEYTYYTDRVAPIGHTMKQEVHAPTCTDEGYTYNCCECGYHFNTDIIPPTGHSLSNTVTEPTCIDEGHILYTCERCDYSYDSPTVPLGHDISVERGFASVNEQIASSTYTCSRCNLNYMGDYTFYHDIFKGAYVDNTQPLANGLDVSYHQHQKNSNGEYLPLDWSTIKSQGYDFAILRAGYTNPNGQQKTDVVFEMNYQDARAAGIQLGVYFYSLAYSEEDALKEAQFLLTLLDGKTFEYPIFFDIEYSDATIEAKGLSPEDLTKICSAFINELQKNGYYAALYTNNKWLTQHFYTDKIVTLFDVWYARYASATEIIVDGKWNEEKFGPQMAMWQFSCTGIIDGIIKQDGSGENVMFDMNYAYKDYPSIIKALGYNGFSPQASNE